MILDYTIPKLENKINEILSKLSDFSISLNTQRSSVSGESTIEGLYIDIKDGMGNVFDFSNYSGGERMRIVISIFLGLASLCRCDFRIFDESVVGLDSETVSNFNEILNNNIFKEISQVLVISHIPEIQDMFENKITEHSVFAVFASINFISFNS